MKRHALQPDQRVRMEMEARAGEYKVERAKAQSEQELQQLLGNPTLPSGANTHLEANDTSPQNIPSPMTRGTRSTTRIERAARRDLVGNQVPGGNALKCTFSGVLSIAPQRFLDSGTSRVECPECAAMRQIHCVVKPFDFHLMTSEKRVRHRPTDDGQCVRQPGKWLEGRVRKTFTMNEART